VQPWPAAAAASAVAKMPEKERCVVNLHRNF
jgi:hypothetical protein